MSNTNKKKSSKIKQFIPVIFFMIIGAVCGVFIGKHISVMESFNKSSGDIIIMVALLFIGIYLAIYLQIIIHEAGHLIFGLLTGYRFSSFRVGSFMWIKEDSTIKLRRLSIAGTGGQCLLVPPDMKDGKYPYVLYNCGGWIINLLSAGVFFGITFLIGNISILTPFLLMLAVIGVAFALINGIPLRLGTVNNDGYNVISVGKSEEALRSFWIQFKANQLIASGVRLKDMPSEWFVLPSEESMKNSMTAVLGVLACNLLMDQKRFKEADQTMEKFLNINSGIVGLHRNLLMVDRIYCELINENRLDYLNQILDRDQKKFMKLMKHFPSVLRTEYAYALLAENDDVKASQIMARFDKVAKKYPYQSEIVAERELISYAEQILDKRNS